MSESRKLVPGARSNMIDPGKGAALSDALIILRRMKTYDFRPFHLDFKIVLNNSTVKSSHIQPTEKMKKHLTNKPKCAAALAAYSKKP